MKSPRKDYKRYTVTSALPYANGPLHLGHLAGAYLPADIFVRYLRSNGKDVVYICGTDEHGAAINIRARQEGISPREVVDKYYAIIKEGFEKFNISFDVFSRTSREIHHETAKEFFMEFYNKGKLIEKTSEQLFDPEAEMFLADRFVKGTCPKCGDEEAYGDQCENCGTSHNATDLINPVSTVTGATPSLKETTHWYLPLDQYQDFLEKYILEDHDYWKSNVYGQCKSWLTDGLQPRAITRDLDWGVKVPLESAEGKVLYVWFDAPIGYISATKEWAQKNKTDWRPYWQDEDSALIHFIGKDNIVFHCIIFPAILKGHGDYILPENVPANEFLNLEGNKFSTSRNYAVWVNDYVEEFPGKSDLMRFVLTATLPENKDNDFTWKDFQARVANSLVADFGNFVNRVLVLTSKNFDKKVPLRGELGPAEQEALANAQESAKKIGESIENYRFREALQHVIGISKAGNKLLADTEPWHLVKNDKERAGTVLNLGVHLVAMLTVACEPFLPETAAKLREMLGINQLDWNSLQKDELVAAGSELTPGAHLFRKVEDAVIEQQLQKLQSREEESSAEDLGLEPLKEAATFDDFQKLDLRAGTILKAEKHPKADRLLVLEVDLGFEKRGIVSGVADHYKPEELVGMQVVVLANLKPKKIRGVESNGMILFAEDPSGALKGIMPYENVPPGSVVK